jgi:8-amino-7-oxononanoate synthase
VSNDYLGLGRDQDFQQRAWQRCKSLWPGASASRLLSGEHPLFAEVESQFCAFKQAPSSLFFTSGYAANEAVISIIAKVFDDVEFFSDQFNHASTIDGLRLCKLSRERVHIYPHDDFQTLEAQLEQSRSSRKVILSEAVFSMHGTIIDLGRLMQIAETHDALIILDEAHSIGVFGEGGRGLISECQLDHNERLITINTCGKAMAAQGAFLCGPTWLRELIINFARPFIYTTAPSPWLAAAVAESISAVASANTARVKLHAQISGCAKLLLKHNIEAVNKKPSHILHIKLQSDEHALVIGKACQSEGFRVGVVRPPTVPQAGLRISLHAHNHSTDVERLFATLSVNA